MAVRWSHNKVGGMSWKMISMNSTSSSACIATTTSIHLNSPITFPSLSLLIPKRKRNTSFLSCHCVSMLPPSNTTQYEFTDSSADVELRLLLPGLGIDNPKDIRLHVDDNSLTVTFKQSQTLMETKQLYARIKAAETIWYLDDDQLVITLRKQDQDLKWPDIVESWESLTVGVFQLLKGTSIYLVGESSQINLKVAQELAVGLGYTPLDTKGLLETYGKKSIESWLDAEGPDSLAAAEEAVLESLSSHVRAVVATLGGKHGAAGRADKWRHLYAGFTVWLSQSEAKDEDSAKDEARKQVYDGSQAYSKADVVVKLHGWDPTHAKLVAQASLSALKQLILSDKKLPGKKSLYIRLGCRGDWPNIKPPGWDPSTGNDVTSGAM